eukprot:gene7953-12420_t
MSNSKLYSFELSCLFYEENKELENELLITLLNHLKNGEYIKGLFETKYSEEFFTKGSLETIDATLTSFLKEDDEEKKYEKELIVMIYGIFCPFIKEDGKVPLDPFRTEGNKKEGKKLLSIGGEDVNDLIYYPYYLLAAQKFLIREDVTLPKTYAWWKGRCAFIHNRVLSHKVEKLLKYTQEAYEIMEKEFANSTYRNGELSAFYYVEKGLMNNFYHGNQEATKNFESAQQATGLNLELTGRLGKRTKFQQQKVAQLSLIAKSKQDDSQTFEEEIESKEVPLDEDTILLDKPNLDDDDEDGKLRIIDQIIILGLCLNIKNTNPKHGLTTLEMIPYVRRVGTHSLNWMVHTHHLLLKSRLEFESNKTIDRSILQLQVLLDQFYEDDPKASDRMKYIYSLHFPSIFEITKELGEKFFSLGVASSALEIFERLEMYEEYVHCLMLSDKIKKAEDFVKERLEIDPEDFKMYWQLGLILDDPVYFEKSWELSNKRYTKAKRSLGRYYMKRQIYDKAIQHFEDGLEINPLYPMAWFSVGCAYMFTGNYQKAISSFHRVTQQENEDFETWANLSSCYMKLEKLPEAYKCQKEALKIKPDNWRLWDNYTYVTLQIESFGDTFFAIRKMLKINKTKFDPKYVQMLIQVMIYKLKDTENSEGILFRNKLQVLIQEIIDELPFHPLIWSLGIHFFEESKLYGQESRIVDLLQKQIRALKVEGWDNDIEKFDRLAFSVIKFHAYQMMIIDKTEDSSEKKKLLQPLLTEVRSIVKRTADIFDSLENYKTLEGILEKLVELKAEL